MSAILRLKMSDASHEQLERFPLRLYDRLMEESMALARVMPLGKRAVSEHIARMHRDREVRRLVGTSAFAGQIELSPINTKPAVIHGQLELIS